MQWNREYGAHAPTFFRLFTAGVWDRTGKESSEGLLDNGDLHRGASQRQLSCPPRAHSAGCEVAGSVSPSAASPGLWNPTDHLQDTVLTAASATRGRHGTPACGMQSDAARGPALMQLIDALISRDSGRGRKMTKTQHSSRGMAAASDPAEGHWEAGAPAIGQQPGQLKIPRVRI